MNEAEPWSLPPIESIPELSEQGVARRFAASNEHRAIFVPKWGCWYIWGTGWHEDERCAVAGRIDALCREEASVTSLKAQTRMRLASLKFSDAVEKLVRRDKRLVAIPAQFDADPWAIAAPMTYIDLRTLVIRELLPTDYMLRSLGAAPAETAACPKWLSFLDTIMAGDKQMVSYLQRMCGYLLTGLTSEHVLFFLWGSGANGKSVFVAVLVAILGTYAQAAGMDIFLVTDHAQHPTGIARMFGARLITATETEEGRRWNTAQIKSLTSSDRISARYMRRDFFDFAPSHKILLSGNHRPTLAVDEAIRRRIHLIPFPITIPVEQRIKDLETQFEPEHPAILRWMLGGITAWRDKGLAPPPAVTGATSGYFSNEDTKAAWLEARCLQQPATFTASRLLYGDWWHWAQRAGERPGSEKAFVSALEDRGFRRKRTETMRGFQGLSLKYLKPVDGYDSPAPATPPSPDDGHDA
jgi:putative DNA primase/helicase